MIPKLVSCYRNKNQLLTDIIKLQHNYTMLILHVSQEKSAKKIEFVLILHVSQEKSAKK